MHKLIVLMLIGMVQSSYAWDLSPIYGEYEGNVPKIFSKGEACRVSVVKGKDLHDGRGEVVKIKVRVGDQTFDIKGSSGTIAKAIQRRETRFYFSSQEFNFITNDKDVELFVSPNDMLTKIKAKVRSRFLFFPVDGSGKFVCGKLKKI